MVHACGGGKSSLQESGEAMRTLQTALASVECKSIFLRICVHTHTHTHKEKKKQVHTHIYLTSAPQNTHITHVCSHFRHIGSPSSSIKTVRESLSGCMLSQYVSMSVACELGTKYMFIALCFLWYLHDFRAARGRISFCFESSRIVDLALEDTGNRC
jgi:hypothetical protein